MSNNASGNICRTGCGRPGQRDYGWKGPAFNCCFGTVACLVEHKRPVRHASVARTCEYLPDRWNAPLFSSSPSPANPNPDPRIQLALRTPDWLTWGRKRRCMQAPHAKKKAFQELLLQSLEWCNDRFALIALSFSVSANWVAPMISFHSRNSHTSWWLTRSHPLEMKSIPRHQTRNDFGNDISASRTKMSLVRDDGLHMYSCGSD